MSLFVASLNSGSNGNCYYIGNDTEAVLIDVGLSCRETERRMRKIGLSIDKVKAIFISHEHTDHIKGLPVIAARYDLPVYITEPTLLQTERFFKVKLNLSASEFLPYQSVHIGGLKVTAFPKFHDVSDPHSFIVSYNDITVGVFTDIGVACEHLIKHFSQCHAAFLEANYDDELLENGRYPLFLKNRIRGGEGHLSNKQALEIFINHRPEFMSHLFLSHLSKDNNDPVLAHDLFKQHANGAEIIVASRYEQTLVYRIGGSTNETGKISKVMQPYSFQMNLF